MNDGARALPNYLTIFHAFADLTDFRHLLFHALLHPIEAFNAYLPHLKMFGLFGGGTFSPASDIPSLAGKVILVTGG